MTLTLWALALEVSVPALWGVLLLFGWRQRINAPLSPEEQREMSEILEQGLESIVDADNRRMEEYYPGLDGLTLEGADIARRLADALRRENRAP